MRFKVQRLVNNFYTIKKSRLIDKKEVDEESISYFEHTLNKSISVETETEKTIYYFVKYMFYQNKNKFYNFIKNSPLEYLVLFTENTFILKHFGLFEKIKLTWDDVEKKYICTAI